MVTAARVDPPRRVLLAGAFGAAVCVVVAVVIQAGTAAEARAASSIGLATLTGGVAATAARATWLAEGSRRRAWALLLPATVLIFVGQLVPLVTGELPIRGEDLVVDVPVFVASLMAVVGLTEFADAPVRGRRLVVRLLDVLLVSLAVTIICILLVFTRLEHLPDAGAELALLVFPTLDLLLLLAAILLVIHNPTSRGFNGPVAVGFVLLSIGEFVFFVRDSQGTYVFGEAQVLLWLAGYTLLMVGGLHPHATRGPEVSRHRGLHDTAGTIAIFALLVLAVGIQAWDSRNVLPHALTVLWVLLAATAGGRQAMVVNDNERLRARLEARVDAQSADIWDLTRQSELILDAAADGVVGLDAAGVVTFANRSAATALGVTAAELLGRPAHVALHGGPAAVDRAGVEVERDDATAWAAHEEADCCLPEVARGEMEMSQRRDVYWTATGTAVQVEVTAAPVRGDLRSRGAVIVFRDVTERVEVERMKDEFVSVVSHELRTPLTSVRASLEMLQAAAGDDLPPTLRRMVTIAANGSERLMRLVNDILDVERLRSGRVPMRFRPCPAAALLESTAAAMQGAAEAAGVSVEVRPSQATVLADFDRVTQALTNLVGNAVKFSAAGQTVELSAAVEGDLVLFVVRDHGRGIPHESLPRIFEPFVQATYADALHQGGSGLGLAICRGIVERHGGTIWAECPDDGGTRISFTLPRA